MASSSSSSAASPHSSTSSASESEQRKGFEFDGTVYPTYNEMVSAKRARNRRFLEQKLSEVASFAAAASKKSDASYTSFDVSTSAASSVSTGNKRKRSIPAGRCKRSSSSFSIDLPLRRNPRRLTSMSASYTDNDEEDDIQGGQKPYASPTWTRSSSSYASSTRKRYRRLASDRSMDDDKSQVSADNSTASANFSAVRLFHAKAIHVPRPALPVNPSETYPKGLRLKTPTKRSRSRGPHANDLLPKSDIMDFSATLEHIILNGFRVRNRETVWRDFYTSGCSSVHAWENEKQKASDWIDRKLYAVLNSGNVETYDNVAKSSDMTNIFNESDDDDDLIPKEYLVPHDKCDRAKTVRSAPLAHPEEHSLFQKNPAAKTSTGVSLLHSTVENYSKGPDQFWDLEFGDGYDPMLFVDACSGYKDEDLEYADETPIPNALDDGQYTTRLLQRCWERAVHAVSSTVTVHLCENTAENGMADELVENNEGDSNSKDQCINRTAAKTSVHESTVSATSFLHREALNVVDSFMDLFLSEKNGLFRGVTDSKGCGSHKCVQWHDVFQLLQNTLQVTKTNTIDPASIDTTQSELSKGGESMTSNVLRFVDEVFHETTDLNTLSVAYVISCVSKHFGFSSIDKSTKKAIRGRLLDLLNGDVQVEATSKVDSCMVGTPRAQSNAHSVVNRSSHSTIQINEKRCPIPLNQVTLKATTMRLVERYGAVSHKFPS